MKKGPLGLLLVLAASISAGVAQNSNSIPPETKAQRDARMTWWRDARFGMFIHWGLYALPAGAWHGQPVSGNGEWIMNKAQIPVADYAALASQFNPVKFQATSWVRIAKAAGMKYIIITAKHHDGFAMFNSATSPFNLVAATPFHRDPLKELAAACAEEGLRLGFYYSQSQDWHHPGGAGNFWDASQAGDYDAYLDAVAVPQVRELLSNYGPISMLWYDTPRRMTEERAAKFLPLHALQPGIIVNNRLRTPDPRDGSTIGDTETPEQYIPPNGYPGKDWETCMTMNDTWGFKKDDQNWKSADDLIRKLSDIASKGGNFLLNVGPDALGEIPAPSVERLQAVGAWLQRNGAAIYGTQAGPFACRLPWGRTTQRGTTLYLHVWEWPTDGQLLLPGVHHLPVKGAATDSPAGLVVKLPPGPTDMPVSIAALEFARPVITTRTLLTVGPDGRVTLAIADAEITGGEVAGDVASFTNRWKLQFSFSTPAEKLWRVSAEVSPSAYNRITVSAPGPFGRSLTAAFQAWGKGPGDFTTVELGVLALGAGVHSFEIKSEMDDLRPLQIRRIALEPVPQ